MQSSRATVVRNAVEVVLRHLDGLPESVEATRLRSRLAECAAESERQGASPPAGPAGNEIMKSVLALHVEVMNLERMQHVLTRSSANALTRPRGPAEWK